MRPTELRSHQLMQIAADFFESQGIPYCVVGSMASMAYGEPRFTNDIDMVADVPLDKVPALSGAFPSPDYHVTEHAARHAIGRRSQFTIIHLPSGFKVDVILPKRNDSLSPR